MVAGVHHGADVRSVDTSRFQGLVLLLPQGVLQGVLLGPAGLLRGAQRREPRSPESYRGERGVFVLNNVHRYFLYASLVVVAFLWYDAVLTFFPDGSFGVKVGSIIWLVNVALLTLYTISCHSMRHLVGGYKDCYTCVRGGNARRKAYDGISQSQPQAPALGLAQPGLVAGGGRILEAHRGRGHTDLTIIGIGR